MRLTQYSDFALRVLIYLAIIPNDGELVRIDDIAKSYGISKNHLTKVIHQLSKMQVIESTRGKNGGIRLAKHPKDINVGSIVRQTEPDFYVVACFADEYVPQSAEIDAVKTTVPEQIVASVRQSKDNPSKIKSSQDSHLPIQALDLSAKDVTMSCIISPACHLKQVFAQATNAFLQVLDNYTLADIISNADELRRYL